MFSWLWWSAQRQSWIHLFYFLDYRIMTKTQVSSVPQEGLRRYSFRSAIRTHKNPRSDCRWLVYITEVLSKGTINSHQCITCFYCNRVNPRLSVAVPGQASWVAEKAQSPGDAGLQGIEYSDCGCCLESGRHYLTRKPSGNAYWLV